MRPPAHKKISIDKVNENGPKKSRLRIQSETQKLKKSQILNRDDTQGYRRRDQDQKWVSALLLQLD